MDSFLARFHVGVLVWCLPLILTLVQTGRNSDAHPILCLRVLARQMFVASSERVVSFLQLHLLSSRMMRSSIACTGSGEAKFDAYIRVRLLEKAWLFRCLRGVEL